MNETQDKINQIQLIQQNIQNISIQRQKFQIQETEIESALNEIEKTEVTYKIIGNIMVKSDKESLKKELKEKHEMLKVRISALEKQEERLRSNVEELQKEVLKDLENDAKQSKTSRRD
ncbi:MAG: hypothetical protein KatS3mg002_0931 [Candidatus Woesearchaeota archaeon]|nr:MAG: hypothetical protein KatS3mg002_0931 [Candidatus Woesearchaeota archaeon]